MNPFEGNSQPSGVPGLEEFKKNIVSLEPELRREADYLVQGAPKTIEAKDLVQETYRRALERRDTFDGANLTAWLKKILKNAFLDQTRRISNSDNMLRGEAADGALGGRSMPPNQIPAVELREVVSRMEKLAPGQLQALEMRVEGYEDQQAAAKLGIEASTFRGQVSRARRTLRKSEDDETPKKKNP